MTVSHDLKFRRRISYKVEWAAEANEPSGEGPWIRQIEGPSWGYRFLPGWGSGPLDILHRFFEIIRSEFDAVIGFEHHPNVAWPVYLTKWACPFLFVSDWCDWYAGQSNQFRGSRIAHSVDAYLEDRIRLAAGMVSVTSRVLLDRALSLGIPPEGAATDYIFPLDAREARRRVGLRLDDPILVQVRNGSMCREVRIFNEVLRKVSNALFVFVGKPSPQAAALAETLGINKRIVCTGWVGGSEYPQYLACADVCVSPLEDNLDDKARWPAKILDFLSAGRATVTNAIGEVAVLMKERPIGVLAGPSDQEIAEEVISLLQDPERRSHLGESAYEVMKREWDWSVRRPLIASLVEPLQRPVTDHTNERSGPSESLASNVLDPNHDRSWAGPKEHVNES
jgi:glycosyltransferase involved in cell wall biosynthesis